MLSTTMIGLSAGTLTTLSFIPQVARCWRRRSVDDLSGVMLIAFTTGVGLWDVYGILLRAWPIIITNSVTFVLALALVAMKRSFAPPCESFDRAGR
jgi:MtN3 and saliva related transmembrane protein